MVAKLCPFNSIFEQEKNWLRWKKDIIEVKVVEFGYLYTYPACVGTTTGQAIVRGCCVAHPRPDRVSSKRHQSLATWYTMFASSSCPYMSLCVNV